MNSKITDKFLINLKTYQMQPEREPSELKSLKYIIFPAFKNM